MVLVGGCFRGLFFRAGTHAEEPRCSFANCAEIVAVQRTCSSLL